MKVLSIIVILIALVLAGCGPLETDQKDKSSEWTQMSSSSFSSRPLFQPTADLIESAQNCRRPQDVGNLIVPVVGTHSEPAVWLRQQGCVTASKYEDGIELAHVVDGVGLAEDQTVIEKFDFDDKVIFRTDFKTRDIASGLLYDILVAGS